MRVHFVGSGDAFGGYHLDYQTLRDHLGELEAEQVVLTHMSTAMLNRLADADVPAARDGMVIDVPSRS